jgi:Zn-finger nucleic acid-binding protein
MELTCPKCHGTMRTYERNGVHVDQCTDCRGIFLDRGELDRLIDAENDWHGSAPAAEPDRSRDSSHERSDHRTSGSGAGLGSVVGEVLRQVQGSKSSSHHESDYYDSDRYGKKRKKESFLGDLFG